MSTRQLTLNSFFAKKARSSGDQDRSGQDAEDAINSPPITMSSTLSAPPAATPTASSSSSSSSSPSPTPRRLEKRYTYDPEAKTEEEPFDIEKERRHALFVQKFGELEERVQKRRKLDGEQMDVDVDAGSPSAIGPGQKKWSPLELQVLHFKEKYPGVLLVIEVGYKFRFFGEDAKIASRVLHIAHFVDRNFYVASIPTHRLSVHVRRLVHAGYKVGVVRQTETAALKAAGENKGGPFRRELKHLYTKGTFVDEMATSELDEESPTSSTSYLLCAVEEKRGGGGSDERVRIGLVAVQPATGDIVYDVFDDGYMRSELETRILHIEPCELLLPQSLSTATEKVIKHVSLQRTTAFGESVRVERMPENDTFCTDYNAAFTYVSDFYTREIHVQNSNVQHGCKDVLFVEILKLPDAVIKALAAILRYLSEFGLQHALKLTKYFTHFSSRSHMLLNGNTMANLEIYRNSTDYSEHGSLFWILNHTSTRFGRRLLRKWVGRPLVDVAQLNERIDAIDELMTTDNPKKAKAQGLLKQLPDIEKGLSRIHYGRSSQSEVVQILNALLRIANSCQNVQGYKFRSSLLNRIFDQLPTIREDVLSFLTVIDPDAESKIDFLRSEEKWPEIPRHKQDIANVERELKDYLLTERKQTGITNLEFVHVAGIEYLLEVKNTFVKKVPREWIKISGTKAVSRFHTPFLLTKLKEREQHKERLTIACEDAYRKFLAEISEKYESFRDIVLALAQLDCLFSLATVANQPNYVKPTFSKEAKIKVKKGRHPMVEKLLGTLYVPNDIDFDVNRYRTMVLTGPNMGGKSSYIRQVALIVIMGQIGSYVPAESAELGVLDAVYTRMGALDNMLAGESTFMVELHETSDIMKQATPRSLVILDELGRGTSTHDGMAIAYAVLKHFITKVKSITLFVTHYPFLAELASEYSESTTNGHMSFLENKEGDFTSVIFLYKLVRGVAMRSYGLNVARLADIPKSVIQLAQSKSEEMEAAVISKTSRKREQQLLHILKTLFNDEAILKGKFKPLLSTE
ncbi:hypothetical protein VTP01DRAFT_7664 [Rhizomucor pusillus]|uniref:uncharacterized protein n=1 Tax=Rhizomucor pusillus TaxID=4840 RepID=UPI003743A758